MDSNDPTYGASVLLIQQATGAPASTARRWKQNPERIPEYAAKLIRFAVFGNLGEVFGDDWREFHFVNGKLYPPFFHGGFTPFQIAGMFYDVQQLRTLRTEVRTLRDDLDSANSALWAFRKVQHVINPQLKGVTK